MLRPKRLFADSPIKGYHKEYLRNLLPLKIYVRVLRFHPNYYSDHGAEDQPNLQYDTLPLAFLTTFLQLQMLETKVGGEAYIGIGPRPAFRKLCAAILRSRHYLTSLTFHGSSPARYPETYSYQSIYYIPRCFSVQQNSFISSGRNVF